MVGTANGFFVNSPTAVAPSKPQWDPRAIIAIDNPHRYGPTCVGTVPSTGRRCGWHTSSIGPKAAEDLLDKISLQAPDAAALDGKLVEVARAMLCYHHPNQIRTVVAKWQAGIRAVAEDNVPQPVQLEPARLLQSYSKTFAEFQSQMDSFHILCEDYIKTMRAKNDAKQAETTAELAKKSAQEAETRAKEAQRATELAQERAAAVDENKRLAALRERITTQLEQAERERSIFEEKTRTLEEERRTLEEERSILKKERSVLKEERSELTEDCSTLESARATVWATAQATEQWTAEVDKWKSEAKAQKSHKLSIRTLRRRSVVPADVLNSVPPPPRVAANVRTGPLARPTAAAGVLLGDAAAMAPALPDMPDVPTTEPGRQSPAEDEEEAAAAAEEGEEEPSKPTVRKLRDLPRRRAKETAS